MQHLRLFLVGLAGSGKSTLGKQLAERLGAPFYDLDSQIENRVGMSIPEYFSQQGQANFRIQESECLNELIATQDSFVLATGGGAPCFHFNMDAMNEHGTTIYLDVNPGDLALRILEDGVENRPLLKSYDQQDLIAEIRAMKEKRQGFYQQAQIKIRDNQITVDMIVSELKSAGKL
ncbi:shikimate kinase [Roseivirga pacifica]|uniref:Shikimate kinase n=1 Tax=Roseivirga pacifica TaxID=1267423 RepID=A0A1I0RJX2_9BACT|nr:shikimate kinase [Roseivirga pacifica]RKQ49790.1 shikimate kinase [Roseivirga pacifica]SEW41352.1 shikimate kinase [Roseivirga pacifica]